MQVEKISQTKYRPVFKKTATMTGQGKSDDENGKPSNGIFVPLTTIEDMVSDFVNNKQKNNKT